MKSQKVLEITSKFQITLENPRKSLKILENPRKPQKTLGNSRTSQKILENPRKPQEILENLRNFYFQFGYSTYSSKLTSDNFLFKLKISFQEVSACVASEHKILNNFHNYFTSKTAENILQNCVFTINLFSNLFLGKFSKFDDIF